MIKIGSKLKILKTANKATALLPNGKISKVASMEDKSEYSDDFIYFIARALTANVPNANGDYFPDDELEKSYESFIGKNLHLNHDADDVAKAVGKIIDAWFVRTDGDIYVVCLCKIDKKLHPELARNIETGIIDSVSMGCSCQECECSVCGCKAHNESEMCEHLKNFLGREIDVNGEKKKVSSINRGITFNELSLVGDPADSNAHMYQIYANKRGNDMKKKAMQDGKTEDVVQEEVKQEIEKTLKDKEETETKAEEKTVKEEVKEVKEEIKETVEQLDQAKEIIEEKKEELKELKEEVKDIKEEKTEETKEEVVEEKKEETEEKVEKEESCKKAETEEEIKDIEEIKEKAKEAIEEDKAKEEGETTETETKEETKEEVVEEEKEEDKPAETVEDVKEKVEDIKEEVMAEIGDIFSPVKDETKEFKITDIFEDNGEKFVETEVEGKKKVYALKNVKVKKQAEAPAKPTTAPSAGMKWVFNKNTNAWEQKPENTKTVEVEAKAEYKYTLIKASKQPRWLVIDKATNKIAQKLFLKDLPKEASSFEYKKVIASAIAEVGLNKVASKLGVSKTAIKADDKYTLIQENGESATVTVKSISINDVTKETFINVQIGDGEGDNIFSLSKFMKMMEEGQIQKAEEVKEEVVEEKVVEETAENNVEQTEDTVPMNQDETSEPMNDLQSSRRNRILRKKASFWEVKKDEKTGKYYLDSVNGKYQDEEGHTYKFNSREDALEEIDFLDAEHRYKKEMKNKKKAEAGDGELVPQEDATPDFKVVPEVKPNETNTLETEDVKKDIIKTEVSPMEEIANLMNILQIKLSEVDDKESKLDFVRREIQDAIDYVDGKPIEEIEKGEEEELDVPEIAEFTDIKWEESDNAQLPAVASVDVDDINWNNINAKRDGAMILAHIYKAKPLSYKVAFKKVNKMDKVASKTNKVSFVGILKEQIKLAKEEVETMKITAQIKEKKELCEGIVKKAMAKGLVHIDSEEIRKNILQGMSQMEAREMAVKKAADEQVKNLMAMDKTQITAYKETVANFQVPVFKEKKQSIGRITASADYDETVVIPWSKKR